MSQARNIMADRVNGTGVTQATVVILGNDQLKVEIPGHNAADIAKLGAAAQLNLRPLMTSAVGSACTPIATGTGSPTASPSPTPATSPAKASTGPTGAPTTGAASPNSENEAPLAAPTSTPAAPTTGAAATSAPATGTATAPASPTASPTGSAAPAPTCVADPFAALSKNKVTIPTTEDAFNKLDPTVQSEIQSALSMFNCASAQDEADKKDSYYIACDPTGSVVYLFQQVLIPGTDVSSASATAPNASAGVLQWTVTLEFKSGAASKWANWTTKYNTGQDNSADVSSCGASGAFPCSTWVGFTLDGVAVSVPVTNDAINQSQTQISGNFTQSSAKELANKLKYGALPLRFEAQNPRFTSATLGATQLKYGLIAGGIGLALVIIYSLIYYRMLGLVTIASLIVSGLLVYGSVVMLGQQIDFTLSLAGIAGFIVAVGITADSFVVFFERIKEEVHEGRSARVAIPRAWARARRTIITADVVSFLAAAVLYYFTSDEVRGFAFTLGLSTLLDIAVVFLFTHPLVSRLSRMKAFGSKAFTGLDAVRTAQTAPRRGVNVRKGAVQKDPADLIDDEDGDGAADEDIDSDTGTGDDALSDADREVLSADARAAARRARLRADKEGGVV